MSPASFLKKIFVPENAPTPVGTPESSAEAALQADPANAGMGGSPEEPAGAPGGADSPQEQASPSSPPPAPLERDREQEQFHYASFDEYGESRLWNQHTRIVLAIAIVLASALAMWWILV